LGVTTMRNELGMSEEDLDEEEKQILKDLRGEEE
jgi:hypothetical protein